MSKSFKRNAASPVAGDKPGTRRLLKRLLNKRERQAARAMLRTSDNDPADFLIPRSTYLLGDGKMFYIDPSPADFRK